MMSTDRRRARVAAAGLGPAPQAAGLWFAGFLLAALALSCRGEPTHTGAMAPEDEPVAAPTAVLPAAAVIDLGSDDSHRRVEGFSLPERVGARFASWSEGELSTVTMNLRGGAPDYLVAFLAEPYHRLGTVGVSLALNGRPLGEARLSKGWRAYQLPVSGQHVLAGRNALSFQYSKTGRPSDFDPQSTDVRSLSVRFDQIQLAPITERAQLAFASKNALALAALGEGWARDPSDRGTGTWTVAKRAAITFHLAPRADAVNAGYGLTLAARTPQGVAERNVQLTLNGAPLGSLVFGPTKSTGSLALPADAVSTTNELWLEFGELASPAQLDGHSKDKRLLGLRVFELDVAPREASAPLPALSDAAAKQPVADTAALK